MGVVAPYSMDGHLALCYNRPLSLLDAECKGSLLPLRENLRQSALEDGGKETACVATLNTEGQVYRSCNEPLRSKAPSDADVDCRETTPRYLVPICKARGRYVAQKQAQFRRKAALALFRWTRSGTDIAI